VTAATAIRALVIMRAAPPVWDLLDRQTPRVAYTARHCRQARARRERDLAIIKITAADQPATSRPLPAVYGEVPKAAARPRPVP
jgi:hypothetical protein